MPAYALEWKWKEFEELIFCLIIWQLCDIHIFELIHFKNFYT